jgi:AraC-like DNA-binding protein
VQRYLDNPRHSMVAISQMLGYSAPSAFTRWFSAQFGQAPQRWRLQMVEHKPRPAATD